MSTFMSRQTFARLVEARNQIVIGGGADGFPMEVFVPWAGNAITSAHGIYYIGAGLDAEEREPNVANRNYDVSLQETEGFIRSGMEGRNHSPFWQFLNALSNEVLGAP